jgi:flagellar biosynthesis/type III secretory pathway chaperone
MNSDLHSLINETLELSKQLILCLDRENACLIARKYDQLMEIAGSKQQLVAQLEQLEKLRQSYASDDDFEQQLKAGANSQMIASWQAVQDNVRQCARKNEVNGRLLQRQNRLTREAMEILTGRDVSKAGIYDANGMTSGQASLLPNIEA